MFSRYSSNVFFGTIDFDKKIILLLSNFCKLDSQNIVGFVLSFQNRTVNDSNFV